MHPASANKGTEKKESKKPRRREKNRKKSFSAATAPKGEPIYINGIKLYWFLFTRQSDTFWLFVHFFAAFVCVMCVCAYFAVIQPLGHVVMVVYIVFDIDVFTYNITV